ncbi:hypothetical protein ACHAXT_004788 [Thalassiosira profunda]
MLRRRRKLIGRRLFGSLICVLSSASVIVSSLLQTNVELIDVSTKPSFAPPMFNLSGTKQVVCKPYQYQLLCTRSPREDENEITSALPIFAEYFVDNVGQMWNKQASKPSRLIATDWFQPKPSYCGQNPMHLNMRCANLGDEIGALLLSKLSGGTSIEKRYDGADIIVIGSVLNYMVSNYNASAKRIGSRYNTTIWGAGTNRWEVGGVCFDFRAVRGPKTRNAFMKHGCNVPDIYGDPALLLPYIYDPRPKILPDPSVDLCIVPHMDDYFPGERSSWWQNMNGTKDISSRFSFIDHTYHKESDYTMGTLRLIDIRTPDAATFIDAINTCGLVSSSSLHGLIIAEAYGIKWSWLLNACPFCDAGVLAEIKDTIGVKKPSYDKRREKKHEDS